MGGPAPSTVVLADDHPMLLRGLRDIVAAEPDFTVTGAANDGQEALALIQALKPQLAVLDLAMPMLDGLKVLKAISHDVSSPRVVILTALISDQSSITASAALSAKSARCWVCRMTSPHGFQARSGEAGAAAKCPKTD